jgi:hypothetical protein
MDFFAWAKKVKQTSVLLDILGKKADELVAPKPQQYRHLPFWTSVDTEFGWLDYAMKERTWWNGAEDVYLQGVAARVTAGSTLAILADQNIWKRPMDGGFGGVPTSGKVDYFDFGWNFRTSNTGGQYMTPANGASLLSSTVLRKQRRDNYLYFDHPKRVKAGDALITQVQARRFTNLTTPTTATFTITLTFFGYRVGALHDHVG